MTIFEGDARRPKPSGALVTIPNVLSVLRGCLGPVVMGLVTLNARDALVAALTLMLLAELSDFLDGRIARRFNQESRMGEVIDPICDSIYHLSVFMAFVYEGWMPAWMLFVIYARDLVIPYLRAFARQAGHDLTVRRSGKIKTGVHAVAQIGVVLVALGLSGGSVSDVPTATFLLLVATAASLYSLVDYVLAASRLLRS